MDVFVLVLVESYCLFSIIDAVVWICLCTPHVSSFFYILYSKVIIIHLLRTSFLLHLTKILWNCKTLIKFIYEPILKKNSTDAPFFIKWSMTSKIILKFLNHLISNLFFFNGHFFKNFSRMSILWGHKFLIKWRMTSMVIQGHIRPL